MPRDDEALRNGKGLDETRSPACALLAIRGPFERRPQRSLASNAALIAGALERADAPYCDVSSPVAVKDFVRYVRTARHRQAESELQLTRIETFFMDFGSIWPAESWIRIQLSRVVSLLPARPLQ